MIRKNKGFTLVEVLITLTIIGVVTLVAFPIIGKIGYQLNEKKLHTYKNIIETGAKIYADRHDVDLFGYQKDGCVDIYYTTLVTDKVIEELDFSRQEIITDKIFVRVKKINGNYSYETYLPKSSNLSEIEFNRCDGSIAENGPIISFTPNGNKKYEKKSSTTILIKDVLGISPNAKITYQWYYVNGTPIATPKTYEFKNDIVDNLSLKVDTPPGITGIIRLHVIPADITNEASIATTEIVKSGEFKLDNKAPDIIVNIFKYDNENKNGTLLLNKKNAEAKVEGWKNHGFYFDFSESNDESGIKTQTWQWNESYNINLIKKIDESRKTIDNKKTNKTFTGRGARYGKVTMCDEANNCRSVEIIVYISPIYYIEYDGNDSKSGSVAKTTCYYEYDCTLAKNGFKRDGYYFTKWNIDGKEYYPEVLLKI